MAHTTTVEIGGVAVPFTATSPRPSRLTLRLRGVSTLTLSLVGYKLGEPDPYLGKPIVLKIDGTAVFSGDVVAASPDFGPAGWGVTYQCRDLRARGDQIPFTDSNSLGSHATYNNDPEDHDKIDARLGRNVGQILADVLTMQANADALSGKGIGAYVSLGPPTLNATTAADLAAMTVTPAGPLQIGGDCLLRSIAAFMGQHAPNHSLWVRADGVMRFLDMRAPVEQTITFGDCDQRVEVSGLTRSVAECYQRVLVRGKAVALPKLLTLTNGGLEEWFAWGILDNAGAKADWTPDKFLADQEARSVGTLTCTDLTHVVISSVPGTQTWTANEWDQAHRRGVLYAWATAVAGFDRFASSRIVANAAKSSGGTSTFTLETPLPDTNFTNYVLRGLSSGASLVWRLYRAKDATIRAALASRFTYPVPFLSSSGNAASLTSYPVASVVWQLPGGSADLEFPDPIVSIDLGAGTFLLGTPTYNYNNAAPSDVRILAAVNTGVLQSVKPATGYEGTSHAVEGLENTLVITVDSWRDPANQVNIDAYAQDQLDSVKDAIVEGSMTIHDLYMPALAFGIGLSIDAVGYTTGWESLNGPVVEVDVSWNPHGTASLYTTTMQVSNRRACYAVGAYLQPERRAADFATHQPEYQPFTGRGQPGEAGGNVAARSAGADAAEGTAPQGGPLDAIAADLNQDWSGAGGNTSGRYRSAAKREAVARREAAATQGPNDDGEESY